MATARIITAMPTATARICAPPPVKWRRKPVALGAVFPCSARRWSSGTLPPLPCYPRQSIVNGRQSFSGSGGTAEAADGFEQEIRSKWLDQKAVSADELRGWRGVICRAANDHRDGRQLVVLELLDTEAPAVHLRHTEVEKDDGRRRVGAQVLQRLAAVAGAFHFVAGETQLRDDRPAD